MNTGVVSRGDRSEALHERRPASERLRAPELPQQLVAAEAKIANSEVRGFALLFREAGARLIVDNRGGILWQSAAAAALARKSGCIGIGNGHLTGLTRHSERLLESLLEDAHKSSGAVDQLLARAANEVPELFVRARSCSGRAAGALALTIRELDRKLDHIPDLTRLYGLTPTEQQVTKMMLQGRSVTEIAAELEKSVLTVRTHIKRSYVKFNVGTKEQLFSSIIRMMVD